MFWPTLECDHPEHIGLFKTAVFHFNDKTAKQHAIQNGYLANLREKKYQKIPGLSLAWEYIVSLYQFYFKIRSE